jgi:putative secretion ATPase (PEP-CTERM system associated)
MYERFYNLRERPFALSPDPAYLYRSRVHGEALDAIRYGVESRAGFIVVTGEIGAGKTTLLQTLLQRLDERTVVARVVNTTLDPRELLEAIMLDFGLDTTGRSKPALLRDLGQFLVQQRSAGRRPLLVIDEAQNLSAQALEEVRLLSNMETERSKLLQILLAGQPNLRETIASPELEQFRQRVAVSYHLMPLDAADTAAYINYRLERAAIGMPLRFPPDAAALVHRRSQGVPRIINVICDAALVFGYAEERHQVDLPLVQEVLVELETTGILPPARADRTHAPGERVDADLPARPRAEVAMPAGVAEAALARASEEAAARAAALTARERAIAQRERELAEQRRVLAEEYRLLRTQRMHTAPRPGGPASTGGRRAAPPPAAPLKAVREDGWRARLKRLLTGEWQRTAEGG